MLRMIMKKTCKNGSSVTYRPTKTLVGYSTPNLREIDTIIPKITFLRSSLNEKGERKDYPDTIQVDIEEEPKS